MIHVQCQCGRVMAVPDHYATRSLGCPACRTVGARAPAVPEPEPRAELDELACAAAQYEQEQSAPARDDAPVRCPRCRSAQVAASQHQVGGGGGALADAAELLLPGPAVFFLGALALASWTHARITCLRCGCAFGPGQGK